MGKLRIVWAVDPLASEIEYQKASLQVLRSLGQKFDLEVFPIHLHGEYPMDYSVIPPPRLDAETDGVITQAFDRLCTGLAPRPSEGSSSGAGLKLFPLEIVGDPYRSLREGIVLFLRKAHARAPDLILTTTHARKGITKWLIGSFTETLVEKSSLPVLVVRPDVQFQNVPERWVFPTDLSGESKNAFLKLSDLAARGGVRVTLVHKVGQFLSHRLPAAFSVAAKIRDWLVQGETTARKDLEVWCKRGAEQGASVDYHLVKDDARSVAEITCDYAENAKGWVALSAQNDSDSDTGVGSTTRKVLAISKVPVWIYRGVSHV